MREIEKLINYAIIHKENFNGNNTTVHFNESENLSLVRLHGSLIATIKHTDTAMFLSVSNAGYKTDVTKNRINAMIDEFSFIKGIIQKNYIWYIIYQDDKREVFIDNKFYSV